jgi:hypothetical protein
MVDAEGGGDGVAFQCSRRSTRPMSACCSGVINDENDTTSGFQILDVLG